MATKIADFFVNVKLKGDVDKLKDLLALKKELSKKTKEEAKAQKQINDTNKKTISDTIILSKNIGIAKAGVLGIAVAFVLVGNKIREAVNEAIKLNQIYTNFQRQTGISMSKPLGMAGAMANVDVSMTPQDIMQNTQQLQQNLTGLQFGMGNVAPYQMMGISTYGVSADAMIDIMRKKLRAYAPEMRTFLLNQMGLDARLGTLADLSDKEYATMKKDAIELYLNADDRKQLQQVSSDWNKAGLKWAKLWDKLVLIFAREFAGLAAAIGDLAPILERILEIVEAVLAPILDALKMLLTPIWLVLTDLIGYFLGFDSAFGRLLKRETSSKEIGSAIWSGSTNNLMSSNLLNNSLGRGLLQTLMPGLGTAMTMMDDVAQGEKNITNKFDINIKANTVSDAEGIYNAIKPIFIQTTNQLSNGVVV